MSNNILNDNSKKPWLNLNIGALIVDGTFSYKESSKNVGDILEIINGVANWIPYYPPIIFGQDITVRISSAAVENTNRLLSFSEITLNSPIYEVTSDEKGILIKESGLYFVIVNLCTVYNYYSTTAFVTLSNFVKNVAGKTIPGNIKIAQNIIDQPTNLFFTGLFNATANHIFSLYSATANPTGVDIINAYSSVCIFKIN